jgi:hypothetical protein
MRKKVAEFTDNESVFVNTAIDDLFGSDEQTDLLDDYQEQDLGSNEDDDDMFEVDDTSDIESNEDDTEESDTDEDEDESSETVENTTVTTNNEIEESNEDFNDYSNTALLALALKEADPDFLPIDSVNKNLKAEELIQVLQESVSNKEKEIKETLSSQYQEIASYIEAVMNGADTQTIQQAAYLKNIADVQLTGEEPDSDLEYIVKSGLHLKNVAPDTIDDIIQSYKDKGILTEKAEEYIHFHKEQEQYLIQNATLEAEQRKREYDLQKQQTDNTIKSIINKGVAKGLSLEKRALEDAIFKPTEIIEGVDRTGKKVIYKIPLVEKRYREFSEDMEQQVAFMQLLANGFDFTTVVNKAKSKVNSELTKILNSRNTQQTKTRKNYFED